MLWTSCVTSKSIGNELPYIEFPELIIDPYKIDYSVQVNNENQEESLVIIKWLNSDRTVTLPYWFFMKIVNHDIDVDTVRNKYEYLRSENAR
ncbi:MAG: hypothetical protein MJ231_04415 [bacterium]|nr:hypothetical protein [bacterium]